ncbi:inosine/xanthosine triphosphatase [Candidatus Woesearchaeota archaeon]|nr:inosine/xanthosine triphosphatase [Candidatus Woesearchaeota archaeon]
MKILVGSQNPVKVSATKEAFTKFFGDVEVIGIDVPSQVPDQPINNQTYDGARNRALALWQLAQEQHPDAAYFVGIEGGIEETYATWFSFGTMCIIDRTGRESFGKSPHFTLPQSVVQKLLAGEELGKVMDHHTGQQNVKQKSGTIGILTNGIMDRKELYVHGLVMALVPFINQELYFKKTT